MPTINKPNTVPADLKKEIEKTFGFVPSFALTTTPTGLRLWWSAVRDFQLSDKTALDGKTKELIGLGVSAQIPCHYCVLFHTEAARLNGATEDEIQEAIFMASVTRQGSTILNGAQLDNGVFEKEMVRIVNYLKNQAPPPTSRPMVKVTN
ncbi:MAG TPA: carboxymuconolactone decarboxylase family protein [Candidatus Thermoplasmatota archaeon]|nr:carboxymuconolactone decarboxylase family protein [Candidatus Thermoplasmatota archaeon]